MASINKSVDVEQTTPNISTPATKTNVYVSAGNFKNDKNENLTIVGFGSLNPYEKDGKINEPCARDAFHKLSQIKNFLDATEATKVGVNIQGKDKDDQTVYMRADFDYKTGISKAGRAFGFNKIYITLQPEKTNEANEIVQSAQKLYATKGRNGYSFDKNCDPELIKKFNSLIKKGANFTLAATHEQTLNKYPKLQEMLENVRDSSGNFQIDFVKEQGAVIAGFTPTDKNKSGNLGENKIIETATKKSKNIER